MKYRTSGPFAREALVEKLKRIPGELVLCALPGAGSTLVAKLAGQERCSFTQEAPVDPKPYITYVLMRCSTWDRNAEKAWISMTGTQLMWAPASSGLGVGVGYIVSVFPD